MTYLLEGRTVVPRAHRIVAEVGRPVHRVAVGILLVRHTAGVVDQEVRHNFVVVRYTLVLEAHRTGPVDLDLEGHRTH